MCKGPEVGGNVVCSGTDWAMQLDLERWIGGVGGGLTMQGLVGHGRVRAVYAKSIEKPFNTEKPLKDISKDWPDQICCVGMG